MSPKVQMLKTPGNVCRVGLLLLPMLRSPDDKHTPVCEVNSSKVVFGYGDYLAICFME